MHISKIVIQNYRCLRACETSLNDKLNILVGNNECGKSTLLEAVNLVLSGQLNGRPVQAELHPHLFNQECVAEYLANLRARKAAPPPAILIELYFADDPKLAALKGTNNTLRENVPGVKLAIAFNPDYAPEYAEYVKDPEIVRTVPVEYYDIKWRNFADNGVTARSIPIKPSLIDASTIRNTLAANRYVVDIMKDSLSPKEQADLALTYRIMRDRFLSEEKVVAINTALAAKKGVVSSKTLSVSLDTTSRTGWEAGVMPQLDAIPMPLVGKGEQNTVKIKLALETSSDSHLVLIEEPENHLSHSNLNALVEHLSTHRGGRQLIITTHSSYVLNKLGIASVLFFTRTKSMTLLDLDRSTQDYLLKLPGHDTLRLILAERAILVEGPSDELVVQKAFKIRHGKMPLEMGVDVITVGALAFKRFLAIAKLLDRRVDVVTDNDGDIAALKTKYDGYLELDHIKVRFDEDATCKTLEPQLLKANGRYAVNRILDKNYATDDELLTYMRGHKTEVALRFFETNEVWQIPAYIEAAIAQ